MGIVPRYTKTVLPAGADTSAAQTVGAAANALGDVAQGALQFKRAKDASFINERGAMFEREVDDFYRQSKIDYQNDPDAGMPELKSFVDKRYGELSKSASPEAKAAFGRIKEDVKRGYSRKYEDYARKQNVSNFATSFDNSIKEISTLAYRAGQGGEDLQEHINSAQAALLAGSTFMGEADMSKMTDVAQSRITEEYLQGLIEKSPSQARKMINSGQFDKVLNTNQIQSLSKQAKIVIDKRKGQARASITPIIKDAIAEVRATGQTEMMPKKSVIMNTYGAEKGAKIWEQYTESKIFGEKYASIATMPQNEINALLEENRPEGEGFVQESKEYSALVRAASARNQQLSQDSMGYVKNNIPSVEGAYQNIAEVPEENRPQALRAAIDEGLAAQESLGVPSYAQKVFPAGSTEQTLKQLEMGNPQERLDYMRSLQQEYGQHWPRAYNELVNAGLPDTTAIMLTMDNPDQRHAAGLLAEATAEGKDLRKALPNESIKDIEGQVSIELEDYMSTVIAQPGNIKQMGRMTNAAQTLAMQYTLKGETPTQAARKAVNEIVGKKYNTVGTARIPNRFNEEDIVRGMDVVQSFIETDERIDPRIIGSIDGTPDSIIKEQYRKELKTSGYYITNEAEDGLYLMDKNGFNVVANKNGTLSPIQIKFSELERMGRAKKKPKRTFLEMMMDLD